MASDQNQLVIVKQLVQAGASLNLYDKVDYDQVQCRSIVIMHT